MIKKDYYEILGISKNANEREIKRAYKHLAMKFHPDRNSGDYTAEKKFKEIKKAYEILNNKEKRAAYDQYGDAAFEQNNVDSSHFNSDLGDIFGDIFGDVFSSNRKKKSNRGPDLCYDIDLSLEESIYGAIREIRIPIFKECNICNGEGTKLGTSTVTCIKCSGHGNIQTRQGFFTVQQTCPYCNGQGSKIKDCCYKCQGEGRIKKSKIIKVKIPSGVNTGDRVRLVGEGSSGPRGGPDGDLYVQVNVYKHSIFEREDNNLFCELPINFITATLGGEVEVPTFNGRVKLKIPYSTQTGRLFRIRGKGVTSINNGQQGDLLCKVIIETPINLNEKQKKLLISFNKSFNKLTLQTNNPRLEEFTDKVKKFFDNLNN